MKEVMTNAWRIAKRAARFYSGKAVEFFAESLKLAWAEFKKAELSTVEVIKGYVAQFNATFDTEKYGEYSATAKLWTPSDDRTRIYISEKRNPYAKIWIELLKKGDEYRVSYDVRASKNADVIASAEMFADHLETLVD